MPQNEKRFVLAEKAGVAQVFRNADLPRFTRNKQIATGVKQLVYLVKTNPAQTETYRF